MEMLRKLLLFILIFIIVYILTIFKIPTVAWAIESLLGIDWFNDYVLNFKSDYDDTFINLPNASEIQEAYETAQSWTIEFWENIKSWVDYTKNKIDNIRSTVSWVKTTYTKTKESYDKTVEFIESNSWVIQDVKDTISSLSWVTEILANTWTIEWIQRTVTNVSDIADNLMWSWTTATATGTIY